MNTARRTAIIGAGVNGLTCATFLQPRGHDVTIFALEFSPETTSDKAAAFLDPFLVQLDSPERSVRLFAETAEHMRRLAGVLNSGVKLAPCRVLSESSVSTPAWAGAAPKFRRLRPSELEPGYLDGYAFETAIVEMPIYLSFLRTQFYAQGGRMICRRIHDLSEPALAEFDLIVNCTGLGSRQLTDDPRLFPIRGQIVILERPDQVERYVLLAEGERLGLGYIVVRENTVVVGGTAEPYNYDLTVSEFQSQEMLERAFAFDPRLASAKILRSVVGLRPARDVVRLELDHLPDGRPVIHNVGHGGAGVSLSVGCANEVVAFAEALLHPHSGQAAD